MKKSKQKKSYSERIVSLVGKSWVSTGKIIKSVGAPPRAARRALRALVKSRQLKSVKVQRERFFAAPGTKAAPPEGVSKGNARPRNRSRKAAKGKKAARGSKKAKHRAAAPRVAAPRVASKIASKPVKKSVKRAASVAAAKPERKKAASGSGQHGTPASAPSSIEEVAKVAAKTTEQSGAAEQTQLLS